MFSTFKEAHDYVRAQQIELVDLVPRNDCDAAIFAGDDLRGTQPDK